MENEMDDSLYQSMSVHKKSLKKIKHRKRKYVNLTIFLLIIHCIIFVVQKCSNFINYNNNNNSESIFDPKNVRNIILIVEDIFITIFLIILLCKIFNDTFIFLFSLLYFVLGIIMLIYLFIYIMKEIRDEKKIFVISFYSINILLFIIESFLLFLCSEIVEKEKKREKREKLGYKKNGKPLIGEDN